MELRSILSPTPPPSILVYVDDPFHPAPNTFVDQALNLLGLSYTACYGSWSCLTTALASGVPYDLVIVANDFFAPIPGALDALYQYVDGGGKLILHSYSVSSQPTHPLWEILGVSFVSDDLDPPDPVYWWQPGYPPFGYPYSVPPFTSLTSWYNYTIYGQRINPRSGFITLAGYTTGAQRNQAAMVVGNGNRTIFKGFLDGQNSADLNSNGLYDGIELWYNSIHWILTPGTWGLLQGMVIGLGYCDSDPSPLSAALVLVQSGLSSWQLYTNSSGYYDWWTQETGKLLDMSVFYLGHSVGSGKATVVQGYTTTFDFNLRWLQPCLQLGQDSVTAFLHPGESTTLPVLMDNYGAGDASWEVAETATPLGAPQDIAWLSTSPISGTLPADSAQPLDVTLEALAGLPYGKHTAYLRIDSNDPHLPAQSIGVILQIGKVFIFLPTVRR